jgi:hypothetical protein
MSFESEIERVRKAPGALLLLGVAILGAFGVGIAVKELLDSRTAGAIAWVLVLTAFVIVSAIRSGRRGPDAVSALFVSVGAGFVTSAVIVVAFGAPALAPAFLVVGTLMLMFARTRSAP